jgi:hypothetical protein
VWQWYFYVAGAQKATALAKRRRVTVQPKLSAMPALQNDDKDL